MTAITIADLDNAQVDVNHIKDFATSPNPTVTDRFLQSKPSVTGLIQMLTAAANRGNWAASTAYAFGDIVIQSSIPYQCAVSHTSTSSFATDLAAHKWYVAGYDALTPRPVSLGGTGADNAGDALSNLGLINSNATLVLNGATTMTGTYLGKAVVLTDSPTPADYTVTLPSGSAVGSIILIRIAATATKWFTIAGSDVGIDGVANRGMWRGESVLLLRETGTWSKIGRVVNPLGGILNRAATQTFTGTGWTKLVMTAEVGDASGLSLCFDSANGRMVARRPCQMTVIANGSIAGTCTTAGAARFALSKSGSGSPTVNPTTFDERPYAVGQARVTATTSGVFTLAAGNYIEVMGALPSGVFSAQAFEYLAGVIVPSLSYTETPLW